MRAFAIAVVVLFALDLRAARFDVVRNGEPVADAEVCLFRAGATDSLITRFFASGDVKCVAAESNVEIGAGHWNVFARKGNALVSERICASTDEYDRECADSFVMGKTKEKHIRLQLTRLKKRSGRVVTAIAILQGQIAWVTHDGRTTELIEQIDAEGRFTWKQPHASDEVLSFTAVGHPLFAMRHPRINDGEELVIRIPNAPRRTFQVFLSENTAEKEGAFLALRVGEVIISINVLGWHLDRHDVQSVLEPGHSVLVPDILATGPIRVILVPGLMTLRYPNIELPLVPEFGSFPQQELGDRDVITF